MVDQPALIRKLTAAYPSTIRDADWRAIDSDGFSGSCVWHGRSHTGQAYAMKLRPTHEPLEFMHACLRSAPLAFTPKPFSTIDGRTELVFPEGRLDVQTWMPGEADSHPNILRLQAAGEVLAQWHHSFSHSEQSRIPAVIRRFQRLEHNMSAAAQEACRRLSHWLEHRECLNICIGDARAEHVRYAGNAVVGWVDFDACRWDHPAVDIARLCEGFTSGEHTAIYEGYTRIRPLPDRTLIDALRYAGIVGACTRWSELAERRPLTPSEKIRRLRCENLLTAEPLRIIV